MSIAYPKPGETCGHGSAGCFAHLPDLLIKSRAVPGKTYAMLAAIQSCVLYNMDMFRGLSPREVCILQLRSGLLDGQAYTPEEVGRKMGVTRERVRQIEAQALSRYITNWPIVLSALRRLWETGRVSELKSPFYEPGEKPANR